MKIDNCSECPFKGCIGDHGASSDVCKHPDEPNMVKGTWPKSLPREHGTRSPSWCPLLLSSITITHSQGRQRE